MKIGECLPGIVGEAAIPALQRVQIAAQATLTFGLAAIVFGYMAWMLESGVDPKWVTGTAVVGATAVGKVIHRYRRPKTN